MHGSSILNISHDDSDDEASNEENKFPYRVEVDDEDVDTTRMNNFSFNHGNDLFLQIR